MSDGNVGRNLRAQQISVRRSPTATGESGPT